MTKALIVSGDVIGSRMAGPGIRCLEMAKALAQEHEVTLAVPDKPDTKYKGFKVVTFRHEPTAAFMRQFEVAVIPGSAIISLDVEIPLVIDLYDPFILSNLQFWDGRDHIDVTINFASDLERLTLKLRRGDFFLCAGNKQRDFWLGMLAAVGRITPTFHEQDPSFSSLLSIVPFGVAAPPQPSSDFVLRERVKGIHKNDLVLIWGGGIWNWFDPETLIRAVGEVAKDIPKIKLYFMGVRHPNPLMPLMKRTQDALDLAATLGLLDRNVFFGPWIEYDARARYLLEADIGISLHFDSVETRFAYRTRILDYFWAGLPVITTEGDALAEVIETRGAGLTVPQQNVSAVVKAITTLARDHELRSRMREASIGVSESMRWQQVLKPLLDFVKTPHRVSQAGLTIPGTKMLGETLDFNQSAAVEVLGELTQGVTVEQRFTCQHNHLCRIEIMFATYKRTNTGALNYQLYPASDPENVVAKGEITLETLRDNEWFEIRFKPVCNSENRRFSLILEALGGSPGNAVTLWKCAECDPPGSLLMIDGYRTVGCLTMRTACLVLPEEENPPYGLSTNKPRGILKRIREYLR